MKKNVLGKVLLPMLSLAMADDPYTLEMNKEVDSLRLERANHDHKHNNPTGEKFEVLPKGCKYFCFTNGEFVKSTDVKPYNNEFDQVVMALNLKNAKRKLNKA